MNPPRLYIQVLGELVVLADGRPVAVPGSRKTRALLAYLALLGRAATREHLCEMLWPHPDDPRAALRWSLTRLRPVLNGDAQHLVADRNTVAVVGLEHGIDLRQVDRLLGGTVAGIGTDELESAAALFRGELLEGLEIPDCHRFNAWLLARSEAARKARRTILQTLTERFAEDPEAALVHARARTALDPLDEGAHVDVVRLLGALGRAREARDQADRCRLILDQELGTAPGPELAAALRGTTRTVAAGAPVVPPEAPATPRAAADAGLFGRAEECVQLEAFLADADRTRVLHLEGEPGIGKSRLLAELRRRAEARGVLVLAGRSWETEMVRPYGVWIDLLAGLPHELVPGDLREDLAPLMPSLGEPLQHAGERERLFGAVVRLVDASRRAGRPILFVFDDIHWIDPASAELVNRISCGPAPDAFGTACAGRPGEFADNAAARALVRGWNRAGRLRRLSVGPLPDRDAAALARSFTASADVGAIVSACGGNPLYLIESAREAPRRLPGAVTALVADRLAALDEPTRDVARWAAVLGQAFPAARLADLLARPLPDLLARTEVLERHGILRPAGDRWDFAHDLLRRSALAGLSGPRRSLMHRRIARVVAAEPDPDGALAGEIAFHAARGGEPALAAAAAVTAGDRALRLAAHDDAWRAADRGLVEVAKLVGGESVELHVELLRVQVLAGLGRRRAGAITAQLDDLVRRARAAGLPAAERTALWLLSVVTEEAGDLEAARRHSLGAETAGRAGDPHTRLRAVANTARCLLQLEREPRRAGILLQEARDLAAALRTRVLDIPWGAGMLGALEGRDEEARAAFASGAAMAADEQNHWAVFECLARLSMLDLAAGNTAAVKERDEALRAAACKLGEGSERALAATLLALARRCDGDEQAGLDAALADLRAADAKGLLAYALVEAGRLDLRDGQAEAAARRAGEALQAAASVGRSHQQDRARWLQGRAALRAQDDEAADVYVRWLALRRGDLRPEIRLHRELQLLGEEIENHRRKR